MTLPIETFLFSSFIRPIPPTARFALPGYYVWCGTMTRTPDGICHLFFSMWPQALSFNAWVTHSQVGYATAKDPLGPYQFVGMAVEGRGGSAWDAEAIHNPTILHMDGKYYLYYVGNYGGGDWWIHRNHQRVGVAVADHPAGPWRRFDRPLIDVTPGNWDHLITTNPSVTATPDGRFMMIYKTVTEGPMPFGGKVLHAVAFSDSPTGPFIKHPEPIFTHTSAKFPAEDPNVFYYRDRYYAVLKDMEGYFTGAGRSLAIFESRNGLQWTPAEHPLVSDLSLRLTDGHIEKVHYLERPNIYFENGQPTVLFCAVAPDYPPTHTFNVQIPLCGPQTE